MLCRCLNVQTWPHGYHFRVRALLRQISAFFPWLHSPWGSDPTSASSQGCPGAHRSAGEEQVSRWCGGPGQGTLAVTGTQRQRRPWAQESSRRWGPFLGPGRQGPACGDRVCSGGSIHPTMALCFYGSQGFPLKCSGLHIYSLPSPQSISLQLTQSSPWVCSPNLMFQPPVPVCVSAYRSQAGGLRAVARTTLFCLPQMSYCTLPPWPPKLPFCPS